MNIEELKRLAEAATPGPWVAWPIGDYPPLLSIATETGLALLTTTTEAENETQFAAVFDDTDAAYIAAANPAAILELIRQRDELLAALRDFSEYVHFEQCATDGAVQYCTSQINRLAFKARAAIAKAEG